VENKKECNEESLEKLKANYAILQKKHSLPEFEKLSEDFEIEKLVEKESIFLLRDISKVMFEKILSYLRLIENIINPSAPSIFIYLMLKNVNEDDKKVLNEIYRKLSKIELNLMKVDLVHNEEKEAEFIKNTHTEWNSSKIRILELVKKFEKGFDENSETARKNYFG